jgi:hypothetical protein
MGLVLSDEDFDVFFHEYQTRCSVQCAICLEHKLSTNLKFFNVSPQVNQLCNHPICWECMQDGSMDSCQECGIALAPSKKKLAIHVCKCGLQQILMTTDRIVCSCSLSCCFECGQYCCDGCEKSTWSRFSTRDGLAVRQGGAVVNNAPNVKCVCGQLLHKLSDCNELSHCDRKLCFHCGEFTLPWETMLPLSHWDECPRWDPLPCQVGGCLDGYKDCSIHRQEITEYENQRKLAQEKKIRRTL